MLLDLLSAELLAEQDVDRWQRDLRVQLAELKRVAVDDVTVNRCRDLASPPAVDDNTVFTSDSEFDNFTPAKYTRRVLSTVFNFINLSCTFFDLFPSSLFSDVNLETFEINMLRSHELLDESQWLQ